jgi:predicted amidohydrolase YtcJ
MGSAVRKTNKEQMIMGISIDADVVLLNGTILTVDNCNSRAEAVAIKNGRFLWVGKNDEAKAAIGKETSVRDLEGLTVIPGFNEAHNHTLQFGSILSGIDLHMVSSFDEVLLLVRERAHRQPEGTWILGAGINQARLRENRLPTRWDLDLVSRNHPVSLKHASMHVMIANSRALAVAGITPKTPNPQGGEICRDKETGEPTGVLLEFPAMDLLENRIPKPSHEELIYFLRRANDNLLSEGITSATDAGVGVLVGVPRQIGAYQDAVELGVLKVRHNLAIWGNELVNYDNLEQNLKDLEWKLLGMGIRSGLGNKKLRIGPFKFVLDGALSMGTAVTYDPYGIDPNHQTTGVFVIEPEKMAKVASVVHGLGWQLAIHAIGDKTLDTAMDIIEKALREGTVRKDARPRIEHCVMVTPRMIKRLRDLGIIVVVQPGFVWGIGDNYISQLSPERAATTIPIRTFLDNNIMMAFSSDRPVADGAPLLGIHAAVNQKTCTGQGYAPDQKISPEEALRCYTMGGAYSTFEEKIKGSIENGKLADLVVLSEDLTQVSPERIKDIQVIATMIGGKFVFER